MVFIKNSLIHSTLIYNLTHPRAPYHTFVGEGIHILRGNMKKLILFFIVLLLAVGLGVLIHNHPATLLINIGHTAIQTSLWFAIIVLMIISFLIYQFICFLGGIYHIPFKFHHFIAERTERKLHQTTRKALCALLEGRLSECENYFYKSAKKESYPFFDYVAAAQAAFEQNKQEDATKYLKKAQEIAQPPEKLSLEIVRVRWQLAAQQYQAALATLQTLQKTAPTHPFILNGLKDIYLALENWQDLHILLPQLKKYGGLNETTSDTLEQHILSKLLDQSSASELEKNWEAIPKKWRQIPLFLSIYTKHLITHNQHNKAEKILKDALNKHRDTALLEQYTRVNSKDPVKQLSSAEAWLKQDDRNPDLLFCLGNLCVRHRLWGKAKTYLEASLKYKLRPEIYPVLGEVLERLDQKHAALDCYKAGLNANAISEKINVVL